MGLSRKNSLVRDALHDAGATTHIVSPESGKLRAWDHSDWGESFSVDVAVAEAKADDYDGLLLPGGVMNPDKLRRNPEVQRFVREFFDARKPVAAICHAPWTLIDAGVVKEQADLVPQPATRPAKRRGRVGRSGGGVDKVSSPAAVRTTILPAEKMIEEFVEDHTSLARTISLQRQGNSVKGRPHGLPCLIPAPCADRRHLPYQSCAECNCARISFHGTISCGQIIGSFLGWRSRGSPKPLSPIKPIERSKRR